MLGMVKVVKGVNVGGVERQGMVNVFFILKRTSELVDVRVAQCWGNERHTICETITSYEFLDARASLAPTPVRLSVRSSYFRIPILSASLSLDDIVLADMVGDMMADMELIPINWTWWPTTSTWKSNFVRELVSDQWSRGLVQTLSI